MIAPAARRRALRIPSSSAPSPLVTAPSGCRARPCIRSPASRWSSMSTAVQRVPARARPGRGADRRRAYRARRRVLRRRGRDDPAECASGTDRIAWAARNWDCAAVVNIQGDEPLIDPEGIGRVASHLRSHPDDPIVTLAADALPGDLDSPSVVKVVLDRERLRALLQPRRDPLPAPAGRRLAAAAPRHLRLPEGGAAQARRACRPDPARDERIAGAAARAREPHTDQGAHRRQAVLGGRHPRGCRRGGRRMRQEMAEAADGPEGGAQR